ncbi:hypothetical protein V8E36_009784 [Tilletia maclaganii]
MNYQHGFISASDDSGASWSEDDIVRIPHHLFLLHPEARRMQDEIVALKSRVATLEQTNAQLVARTAQLSALVASKPSAGPNSSSSTSTSAQTYAQVLSYQKDDGKILINGEDLSCIPQRPLEELADEETMCWTQAHAQRLHANQQYGKHEITREADGQVIESDVLEVIEKEVRFACAALDQLKMPDWLKGKARTYELYTTYFLPDALKWVQKRLKAQVETANNAKRSYTKTQQSDRRASKKQRRAESPAASRPAARPMTAASADTTTKKGKGKARAREPVPQRQADTDSSSDPTSDQDEGRDAFAPFSSSYGSMFRPSNHAGASCTNTGAGTSTSGLLTLEPTKHTTAAHAYKPKPTPAASQAPALRTSARTLLPGPGQAEAAHRVPSDDCELAPLCRSSSLLSLSHEPHGPSMEAKDKETANRGPAVNELADTGTATAASILASMRQSDANSLAPPTLSSLRTLLKTRYSGLQVKDKVASALEVLENAEQDGLDPDQSGSPGFVSWPQRLETAEPNYEDEDKSGPSFGHDELGSWVYHSPLQKRKTYGSIRNACRLLAALLRIWAVAKEDCLKLGSKLEPTVKASLETITGYIEQAFTDVPLSSAPPSGPSNKLKKVSLVRILALAKKRHEPKASKEVLLAAVRRGIDDGSVKITAVQFKELLVGLDNITDAEKMAGSRAQADQQIAAKVGREEHSQQDNSTPPPPPPPRDLASNHNQQTREDRSPVRAA